MRATGYIESSRFLPPSQRVTSLIISVDGHISIADTKGVGSEPRSENYWYSSYQHDYRTKFFCPSAFFNHAWERPQQSLGPASIYYLESSWVLGM